MNRILSRAGGLVFLVLLLLACDKAAPTVSNSELLQRLQGPQDMLVVLDVRSPTEYASGHVPGAVNIPHDQLALRMNELRGRDNAEFVVYCESGRRAAKAESILKAEGFLNVRHLQGDMAQWRAMHLPVEQ
jgi:rhodanese-related sulfurtransferase